MLTLPGAVLNMICLVPQGIAVTDPGLEFILNQEQQTTQRPLKANAGHHGIQTVLHLFTCLYRVCIPEGKTIFYNLWLV